MKLIVLLLTIASICIGIALGAIGSIYLGVLIALAAIIVAGALKLSRRLSDLKEHHGPEEGILSS